MLEPITLCEDNRRCIAMTRTGTINNLFWLSLFFNLYIKLLMAWSSSVGGYFLDARKKSVVNPSVK